MSSVLSGEDGTRLGCYSIGFMLRIGSIGSTTTRHFDSGDQFIRMLPQ